MPAFESRRVRTQPLTVTGASCGACPARMSRTLKSLLLIARAISQSSAASPLTRHGAGACRLERQAEQVHQAAAADRRDGDGARVTHPLDPFQLEAPVRQRRADGAADVRPPFGPVHARAAKDATLGARCRK